jgi:hypothetical protein
MRVKCVKWLHVDMKQDATEVTQEGTKPFVSIV